MLGGCVIDASLIWRIVVVQAHPNHVFRIIAWYGLSMHIRVLVTAGARKESLREVRPDTFEIAVRELPVGNAANRRVRARIAEHLGVPVRAVTIVSGHRASRKTLQVVQLSHGNSERKDD